MGAGMKSRRTGVRGVRSRTCSGGCSPPRPYRSGRPGGASERGTERAKVQGALIHRGSHPHGFGLMATGIAGSSESPLPRLCPTIVSESASRHAAKPAQRCGDLRD